MFAFLKFEEINLVWQFFKWHRERLPIRESRINGFPAVHKCSVLFPEFNFDACIQGSDLIKVEMVDKPVHRFFLGYISICLRQKKFRYPRQG